MALSSTLKQRLGCWLHERWRTELVLRAPRLAESRGLTWLDLCNRHERLSVDAETGGRICHWADSSPLTVARFFPRVGGRLIRHCLREWPLEFATEDRDAPPTDPDVSLIMGIRGPGRLPQFLASLATLRAQRGVNCEVILVEQSWEPQFADLVPVDVRYIHQQATHPDMPYNRSWALNGGARIARGEVLVLYDADMLAPARLAEAIIERIRRGLAAVRIARLVFYLDQPQSTTVWTHSRHHQVTRVAQVVQNTPSPVAITRDAFLRIGGYDESFFGWGGEDNEFLDRLRTLNLGEGGFLPIVHLWHPEAPNRSADRNAAHLQERLSIPVADRIREMNQQGWGQYEPATPWAATPDRRARSASEETIAG